MPSPSPESSSFLSWRHAIWSMHSPFSSLLQLARCSPLPSCSFCQRFDIHPHPHPCTCTCTHKHTPLLSFLLKLFSSSSLHLFLLCCNITFLHPLCATVSALLAAAASSHRLFLGSNKHCWKKLLGFSFALSKLFLHCWFCLFPLYTFLRYQEVLLFSFLFISLRNEVAAFFNSRNTYRIETGTDTFASAVFFPSLLLSVHFPLYWDRGQQMFFFFLVFCCCLLLVHHEQLGSRTVLQHWPCFVASLRQLWQNVVQLSFGVLQIKM